MKVNSTNNASEPKKATVKRWTDISGKLTVWAAEFKSKKGENYWTFSTSVGKKDPENEGQYINLYANVHFAKSVDLELNAGKNDIEVTEGFLSVDKYKNGNIIPAIVIMGAHK